jgi:hypothetical protein
MIAWRSGRRSHLWDSIPRRISDKSVRFGEVHITRIHDLAIHMHMTDGVATMRVCSAPASGLPIFFLFKTRVWEQRRWNRWGLVTRIQETDNASTDTRSLSAAACSLVLCHASRNLRKRSGVPEDPAKPVDPACERASEGPCRTPMRKKIHPHSRSSPSRHKSRMRGSAAWRHR